MFSTRKFVKKLIPPICVDLRRRVIGGRLQFSGNPADWAEAKQMSTGYEDQRILDRVRHAAHAVVAGRVAYERDSVTFEKPELPFPILAALMRAAARNAGILEVLDFGGSLGSTYYQCRAFFEELRLVRWVVVEQRSFAEIGQREFSTAELQFVSSVRDVRKFNTGGVILASSSLQYVEDPAALLESLSASNAMHFIIDRTPFSEAKADRLCIQKVPRAIYQASYPCWIFSHSAFGEKLSRHWRCIAEFPCAEGEACTQDGLQFEFCGLILERRN